MQKNNLYPAVNLLRSTNVKHIKLFFLVLLVACGGDRVADTQPQKWQDAEVRVESRPSPPRPGVNEFLVIVTGKRGPIHDVMVSVRTDDQDQWIQAIQDGEVGVYRRAAKVAPGTRSVLQVQMKRNGVEGVLRFPLNLSP
ncbi:MAG: hypothetical protein DID90_2727554237 [Candidatus Nitrotoga sp. LAW]|nr:MAG: hypothetical protein DID90_2727554237 [Candidatus Nitrotoga sp. LAW]